MRNSFGAVSFINSLPFFCGGKSARFDFDFRVPSELNAASRAGVYDVSMISRWAYRFCEDEYAVLPRFCIGGDGEIMSIKLFSKFDISELYRGGIFITPQTGTSSRAYRKICLEKYGFDIAALPRQPLETADSAVLIGDAALAFDASRYPHSYDLGELWRDWAKCKMLYAIFVIRRGLFDALSGAVAEYLDASLAAFESDRTAVLDAAERAANGVLGRGVLEKYYTRLIYKMDADDFQKSFEFVRKNENF